MNHNEREMRGISMSRKVAIIGMGNVGAAVAHGLIAQGAFDDYVLIDTHPDFSTITQNMIIISDFVFSPIEPSEYGFISKSNLELRMDQLKNEVINVESRKSFVTADLKFIGNRIKHNTKSSHDFVEEMKKDDRTIALIPEREIFNKTTLSHDPLIRMQQENNVAQTTREFFKNMENVFDTFTKQ